MNLPNKLTMVRMIMVPFFVAVLLIWPDQMAGRIVAEVLFCVASLTDMLDGKIARKHNLVTNFGKFMDPLADKLLVCSAMICMVALNQMPAWVCIIIIAREFIVTGFRTVAAEAGVVIAASYWGKFKTVFEMSFLIVMIINFDFAIWQYLGIILMYVALVFAVISMIDYLGKNREVIKDR